MKTGRLVLAALPRHMKETKNKTISCSAPPPQTSSRPSTRQAEKLRSIISLYHTTEHFAPLNNNQKLVRFIDNSILFKKPPSAFPPAHNADVLASTIKLLTLNRPILRPGENENDLNPITSSHRIRVGNLRWQALKDALCGTFTSQMHDEPTRNSRFGSKFGALDWPGSSNSSSSHSKPGLEIVEENLEIVKQIVEKK